MEQRTLQIPQEFILEGEEWKPMPKYPDLFGISNLGRSWSITKQKIIKPWKDKDGYLQYRNYVAGLDCMISFRPHREVAAAFIPNPHNYPQVHHIDDDKLNNSASNLKYGTAKMNQLDAERNKVEGYAHRRAVVGIHIETGEKKRYPSVRDVEKDGFNFSNVRQCCKGKRHKAHGYRWKYADEANVSNMFLVDKIPAE
jgi:hypothetical protein